MKQLHPGPISMATVFQHGDKLKRIPQVPVSFTCIAMKEVREFQVCDQEKNECKEFANNIVHTNKFTPLNFLPMFLMEKFRKSSNLFFLICSILEVSEIHARWACLPTLSRKLVIIHPQECGHHTFLWLACTAFLP